jgi:hypothetical protein
METEGEAECPICEGAKDNKEVEEEFLEKNREEGEWGGNMTGLERQEKAHEVGTPKP